MARICPKDQCTETSAHGHGTDETFLPRIIEPRGFVDYRPEPDMPEVPTPGGFDAALYDAFLAGVKARHQAGIDMRMMSAVDDFRKWREGWASQ